MTRDPLTPYTCRGCRGAGSPADVVCDLGAQPSSQHFPPPAAPAPDPAYPLALWLCPGCGLAQLVRDDSPDEEAAVVEPDALRRQADAALHRVADRLPAAGTVREFPSPHGGSWLRRLAAHGRFTPTDGPADVVVDSFGVMHAPDQRAAFAARAAAVGVGGVLLLNVQHLGGIVAQGQWNAVRHGHFAYYSLTALSRLLQAAGLVLCHVEEFDLYGGTALIVAARAGDPTPVVAERLAAEHAAGLDAPTGLAGLQAAVATETAAIRSYLAAARERGRRVVGYPAASRTVVVATAAGLGPEVLPAVYDAAPTKAGRCLPRARPGGRIPIRPAADLAAADADEILLFLPDLAAELARREPAVAERLVRFDPAAGAVVPLRAPAATSPRKEA